MCGVVVAPRSFARSQKIARIKGIDCMSKSRATAIETSAGARMVIS